MTHRILCDARDRRREMPWSDSIRRFVRLAPLAVWPKSPRKSPLRHSISIICTTLAAAALLYSATAAPSLSPVESNREMPKQPKEIWSTIESGRRVALDIATSHVVRLRVGSGDLTPHKPSYAVVARTWPRPACRLTQEKGFLRASTSELEIELRTQPFGLVVRDRTGRVLFETAQPGLRFEGEASTLQRRRPNGEMVFGMGEVGETFDRAGGRYTLWNVDDFSRNPRQNFYCQIPFGIHVDPKSGQAFGLFVDNPGKQIWDLGKTRPTACSYTTVAGDLEVWLLFSGSISEVLRDWADLTGHMDRPPLWGLGYHQCRWSYYPESRVREIAAEFRRRRIPCDAIYLDIDYMDGYKVFTWHPQRFGQPEQLLADLADQGFRVVTIVDPGVKIDPQYTLYRDFVSRPGFFCLDPETSQPFVGSVWPGKTHFPDFTYPDVRAKWGEYQQRALLDKGVAGIWNDMNEPHIFETKEFPGRVIQDDFGRKSPHARIHQVYGLTMAQASREGFERARPHQRPFIITRSGWAGVQRYALMWTGDNQSTWASMTLDLQLNLSMGLSGIAFVGCDIGGFAFDCYPELYARWIEWGVFQPFCRTHTSAGTADQEPWSFGPAVENVARAMIEFRMQLLPYLYTTFVEASELGLPVNRPLILEHPADANCHRLADEFMLGSALLVAPVLEPAKDRRMVYLPVGTWYHWWSDQRFSGPTYEIIPAPPAQPPLFARAGSVIPMQEPLQYVGEKKLEETRLEVFIAPTIEGMLVEDDGETLAYRQGKELRTSFRGTFDGSTLEFHIAKMAGDFQPPRKTWRLRLHGLEKAPASVTCGNKPIEFQWNKAGICEISLPAGGREIILRANF